MNSANQYYTGFISPAQERDSERWNSTLRDFLQPMIDWIAESAARESNDERL